MDSTGTTTIQQESKQSCEEKGFVVWFTGLSGSGKTTISEILIGRLRSTHRRVEALDGDEVRRWLSPDAGFSREDREKHLRRVAYVAHLLARNGVVVVASFVSPYRSTRDLARRVIGDFVEVYVKCPLEICVRRDPKGLYAKALHGEIRDMTGLQDPYEEPLGPEITVETDKSTPQQCAQAVLDGLTSLGYHPCDRAVTKSEEIA